MGRPPKPWYWNQAKIWCVTLDGKRIKLDPDEEKAKQKFHQIMANRPADVSADCVVAVMDEMIEWTRKNRAAGTFRFYREHAQQFTDWLKGIRSVDLLCSELSVDLFEDYLEECSVGRRNGAVQMIKRVYSWANRRGRIQVNPIMALEKPPAGSSSCGGKQPLLSIGSTQWNKDNIGIRMDNLRDHLGGKQYALYDIRHTWITNKVKAGMDIHLIAKLAGTSIAMIERVYDKSDEDANFMLTSLRDFSPQIS